MKTKRNNMLSVKLTEEEITLLRERAAEAHMTQGEFIGALLYSGKPLRKDFESCIKVLSWLDENNVFGAEKAIYLKGVIANLRKYMTT